MPERAAWRLHSKAAAAGYLRREPGASGRSFLSAPPQLFVIFKERSEGRLARRASVKCAKAAKRLSKGRGVGEGTSLLRNSESLYFEARLVDR